MDSLSFLLISGTAVTVSDTVVYFPAHGTQELFISSPHLGAALAFNSHSHHHPHPVSRLHHPSHHSQGKPSAAPSKPPRSHSCTQRQCYIQRIVSARVERAGSGRLWEVDLATAERVWVFGCGRWRVASLYVSEAQGRGDVWSGWSKE